MCNHTHGTIRKHRAFVAGAVRPVEQQQGVQAESAAELQNVRATGEMSVEMASARPAMDQDARVEPPAAVPVVDAPRNSD